MNLGPTWAFFWTFGVLLWGQVRNFPKFHIKIFLFKKCCNLSSMGLFSELSMLGCAQGLKQLMMVS